MKLKKGILYFILFSFNVFFAFSQSTANYSFSTNTSSSLTDMSSSTTQLVGASSDDVASSVANIGFDFWFMGTKYTQFSANSNGLMRLGATAVGSTFTNDLTSSSNLPIIAPFWDDLLVSSTGKIHYKVTGSSPNSVLIVEWKNMSIHFGSSSADGTFQVRLYENTGVIEYVYGSMAIGSSSGTATVSIGFSNASANNSLLSVTSLSSPAVTTSVASVNNSLVNSSTAGNIANLNSAADGSRRMYKFTPPVPTAPSSSATNTPTSTTMNVTWTDNSSNEVYFLIYRSDDGGTTYNFISQVAANTTSSAQSGLSLSTTYYWKIIAVSEGALSSSTICSGTTTGPGTCTGNTTGNWSSTSTWSCGHVPTSTDNVIIADSKTVTIDQTANAYSLTVGQGASGTLKFDGTARTITIVTDVTVASGGIFEANTSSNQTGHIVSVGGNYTNNGTTDFYVTSNRAATLKFTGSSNATFSGTGGTTDLYKLTIDKGSSYSSVLEISTSNFTVTGVSTTTTGFLTLTNGMLKISGSFSGNHYVYTSANYSIGSTCGLWLNNSNFVVTAQSGMLSLYGKLKIDAGTYNIGTGIDHDLGFYSGGIFEISNGTLNVAESIYPYTSSPYTYTQTGGTVNVCTVTNPYGGGGSFHLGTSGICNMSGGTIVLRLANTYGGSASSAYDYINLASTRSVTGGTVQFGDASSGAAKTFKVSAGYFPNLTINNTSGNHIVQLSQISSIDPYIYLNTTLANNTKLEAGTVWYPSVTFVGNVTVGSGATYTASNPHSIGGNFTNNGTFTHNNGTISFNGSANQSLSGTSTSTFYNLTNSNTSTGLTLNSSISVTNTLLMSGSTADIDLNGNTIDLSSTGTISGETNSNRIYGASGSITTTRNISSPSALNVAGMGLILTSGSNLGSTIITRNHSDLTNGDFSSILRNYTIHPNTNSGLNATIKVNYFDKELNGLSTQESDFVLWRSTDSGTTWTNRSGTENTGSNFITLGSIDAFSLWAVGPASGVVLGVTLVDFNGTKEKNDVKLKWETASEENSEYFEVQASFDGFHFHPLGVIDAAGYSIKNQYYSFIDDNYINGINYYKLKLVDIDGQETFSNTIAIDMTKIKTDLIMTVNSLGQKVDSSYTGIVFDIYSDGSSVKRLQ